MQPREWRSRLFLAHYGPARAVELPRSPEQFRAVPTEHRDVAGTEWWVVRADHPGDVPLARLDQLLLPAYLAGADLEEVFPVQVEFGHGTWEEAAEHLTVLGQ